MSTDTLRASQFRRRGGAGSRLASRRPREWGGLESLEGRLLLDGVTSEISVTPAAETVSPGVEVSFDVTVNSVPDGFVGIEAFLASFSGSSFPVNHYAAPPGSACIDGSVDIAGGNTDVFCFFLSGNQAAPVAVGTFTGDVPADAREGDVLTFGIFLDPDPDVGSQFIEGPDPGTVIPYTTSEAGVITVGAPLGPQVIGVEVGSADWDTTFLDHLRAAGLGDGGFEIPVGSGAQLQPLTWTALDRIVVRFNTDVQVQATDLAVYGVNELVYEIAADDPTDAGPADGFRYDAATFTATWTLADPVVNDKLLITLPDTIVDSRQNALDGEWLNPVDSSSLLGDTYPSGDGIPGGSFAFRIDVVEADLNGDGVTSILDIGTLRSSVGSSAGDPGYSIFNDVNGDGVVELLDALALRAAMGKALPAGEPVAPASAIGATASQGSAVNGSADLTGRLGVLALAAGRGRGLGAGSEHQTSRARLRSWRPAYEGTQMGLSFRISARRVAVCAANGDAGMELETGVRHSALADDAGSIV